MARYTVSFLGPDDEIVAEEGRWFDQDDDALDEVGRSDHPNAINLYCGLRMVAHVPAWPPEEYP